MTELRLTVDHLRLSYNGPFDANELYRNITSLLKEKGFDLETQKEFEHHTKDGKQIEWQLRPWKQISDNLRYLIKIRILISNYNKVDAVIDKKKVKIGSGKAEVYLDGYADLDQHNRWEYNPFLQFLRALYNNFIYKIYTERFEQRLTYDAHHLYNYIEQTFNMYKHYHVVSKVAPFAHTTN